jgi:hypothetical protein
VIDFENLTEETADLLANHVLDVLKKRESLKLIKSVHSKMQIDEYELFDEIAHVKKCGQ